MAFVPADFKVPTSLKHSSFLLEILEPSVVELDFDAVMSSREKLRSVFAEQDQWPADDMTLEENLNDLITHQKEFLAREAFAYTVLDPTRTKCLGCIYIEPSNRDGIDSEVYFWLRDDTLALEDEFSTTIREWLSELWPFDTIAYPGRDISWKEFGPRSHNHLQRGAIRDS